MGFVPLVGLYFVCTAAEAFLLQLLGISFMGRYTAEVVLGGSLAALIGVSIAIRQIRHGVRPDLRVQPRRALDSRIVWSFSFRTSWDRWSRRGHRCKRAFDPAHMAALFTPAPPEGSIGHHRRSLALQPVLARVNGSRACHGQHGVAIGAGCLGRVRRVHGDALPAAASPGTSCGVRAARADAASPRARGKPLRNRLMDVLDDSWRRIGCINLIVGTALAIRWFSPMALKAFLLGRVDRQVLTTVQDAATTHGRHANGTGHRRPLSPSRVSLLARPVAARRRDAGGACGCRARRSWGLERQSPRRDLRIVPGDGSSVPFPVSCCCPISRRMAGLTTAIERGMGSAAGRLSQCATS